MPECQIALVEGSDLKICTSEAGHEGEHEWKTIDQAQQMRNLANAIIGKLDAIAQLLQVGNAVAMHTKSDQMAAVRHGNVAAQRLELVQPHQVAQPVATDDVEKALEGMIKQRDTIIANQKATIQMLEDEAETGE